MLLPPEILAELILAFRLGSQISRDVPHGDLFNEELTRLVVAHLGERDRHGLALIQNEGKQGLLAARSRAAPLAADHFGSGDRLLATLPLSDEARLCAESFFAAQKAYFFYVQLRYQDAIELIERAFANDRLLETRHGFDILLMHRLQLLNNLMRIEARRQRSREAFSLGAVLLRFIEAPGDDAIRMLPPPWDGGWLDGLDRIPPGLLAAMHAQIAAELVSVLHRMEAAQRTRKEILCMLDSLVSGEATTTQIGRWLGFQIVRIEPRRGCYFSAASAILRIGCVPSEPLWRSVALDVTRLLRPGLCIQASVG